MVLGSSRGKSFVVGEFYQSNQSIGRGACNKCGYQPERVNWVEEYLLSIPHAGEIYQFKYI